jgi:hypothetical protein
MGGAGGRVAAAATGFDHRGIADRGNAVVMVVTPL